MVNPFSMVWDSLKHLATQARRLGDALGAMADQVEQRSALVDAEEEKPALPAAEVNGHHDSNGRRRTRVASGQ